MKKRYSEEQIIAIVKQCEAGRRVPELAGKHGISEGTIYAWKAKFTGMEVADAKGLRALEEENRRLKQTVADLRLDKEALKSVITKNDRSLPA